MLTLFSDGFEKDPWTKAWGMAWGPEPASHGELVTGKEALEGHSLRVTYPKGGFGSEGGYLFRTELSRLSIVPQDSLYLRYYVRFEPGFDFVKGGKLPGLAGGAGNTGGHKPSGTDGWSARIMWRADGKIVQYVYYPDQPGDYGQDFDWDFGGCPRYFRPGQWHCVETRVELNHPGKKDGRITSWLDGDKALEVGGLRFRDIATIHIDQFQFETFFGGGDASWASPKDQRATFDDFAMATTPVGPLQGLVVGAGATASPTAVKETPGMLVYDGDHPGWVTSSWSEGTYDNRSSLQNHSAAGSKSFSIGFPKGGWGGAQFTGNEVPPGQFHRLSFWLYPTSCAVEFRVRLEEKGSQVGVEKALAGAGGWVAGQWNRVSVDLSDLKAPGSFDRIVLTSNSAQGSAPFFVDDLRLEK